MARLGDTDADDLLFLHLQLADLHARRGEPGSARAAGKLAQRIADNSGSVEMRAVALVLRSTIERNVGDRSGSATGRLSSPR